MNTITYPGLIQTSLIAFKTVDEIDADIQREKIIQCLQHVQGTDRSHLVQYTGIPDKSIGWRLKELRDHGIIEEEGICISTSRRPAHRIILKKG